MDVDVVIVGGSFAGISAALTLARARRSLCILDTGEPRNRFATASHGMFGRDGSAPGEMLREAGEQLDRYPHVQRKQAKVIRAQPVDDGFSVMLDGGDSLRSRKLILAFGVVDDLPELPGLRERWGRTVVDCPYCHAYEFSGRQLGVLSSACPTYHKALLMADWGPTTFFLNGVEELSAHVEERMKQRGVHLEREKVVGLEGEADQGVTLHLADDRRVRVEALFLETRTRMGSPLAENLGCDFKDGPYGPLIRTNDCKETSVPGVFAVGDIAAEANNTSVACADGVKAGMGVHQSLVLKELA